MLLRTFIVVDLVFQTKLSKIIKLTIHSKTLNRHILLYHLLCQTQGLINPHPRTATITTTGAMIEQNKLPSETQPSNKPAILMHNGKISRTLVPSPTTRPRRTGLQAHLPTTTHTISKISNMSHQTATSGSNSKSNSSFGNSSSYKFLMVNSMIEPSLTNILTLHTVHLVVEYSQYTHT